MDSTKASAPSTGFTRFKARFQPQHTKPRYVTKQRAKIMDQDSKMEASDKKQEESEKWREQSEEKSRAEFLTLQVKVESRICEVEKHDDLMQDLVEELQEKVGSC
uniref:Retrotransposon protein, putative, unclassified n=1 Tax=Oryza sativa subsp. japonica TaxID=39947 RepID=Q10HF4_ORYSJ|nr:retrotransposon protein, putative, unclassified [Oryza sativa Japonica Group]